MKEKSMKSFYEISSLPPFLASSAASLSALPGMLSSFSSSSSVVLYERFVSSL